MNIFRSVFISVIACLFVGCANPDINSKITFDDEKEASQAYNDGRYDQAIEKYEFLVQEFPKDPTLWFRLANAFAKNGEPEKAINAYQNTLLLDQGHEKAWYNMGVIQMQLALKTFIDMQQNIPPGNPVRERGAKKMDGLMDLLGRTPEAND